MQSRLQIPFCAGISQQTMKMSNIATLLLLASFLIDASHGWSSQPIMRNEAATTTLTSQGWSSKPVTVSNDVPSAAATRSQEWSSEELPIESSAASTTRSQQWSSPSIEDGAVYSAMRSEEWNQEWNSASATRSSTQSIENSPQWTRKQLPMQSHGWSSQQPASATRSQGWSSTPESIENPASTQQWTSEQRPTVQSHGWSSQQPTRNDVASVDRTQGISIDVTAPAGARTLVVDQRSGPFKTIQGAVNAVPDNNQQWIVIQVAPGVYREKVYVPLVKTFIELRGSGMSNTFVTWADTALTQVPNPSTGTLGSASFSVAASRFIARDISFKNEGLPPPNLPSVQAVAAAIEGDMSAFYNCGFYGRQDTLYDYLGRHYYENCFIEGTVDFVFGNAQSIFKSCTLNTIARQYGAIAASQRTRAEERTGLIFVDCKITGTVSPGLTYLGRAWGPFARTIYVRTTMDNVIHPQGWNDWNDPSRQKTVDFGQFNCAGPGAVQPARVGYARELRPHEVAPYLNGDFIDAKLWL